MMLDLITRGVMKLAALPALDAVGRHQVVSALTASDACTGWNAEPAHSATAVAPPMGHAHIAGAQAVLAIKKDV